MNANRLSLPVDATLAGTLAVTLKAFTPAQNASFDILDFLRVQPRARSVR